jgi:uncharacterized delta-60 repeat protein
MIQKIYHRSITMKFKLRRFLVYFFLLISLSGYRFVFAQQGSLDFTFSSSDLGNGLGDGPDNSPMAIGIQTDGKIVIGGSFNSYNTTQRNHVARLNTDGRLDVTFNPGSGADSSVRAISIQPDGKIILGGRFTVYNSVPRRGIVRVNSDGSIDPGFLIGNGFSGTVNAILVQGDGKIIAGGSIASYNNMTCNNIVRLNANGSIDGSFISGSGVNGVIYSMVTQNDGKIIVGGNFTSYNGQVRNNIVRINANGSIDQSYNVGSGTNGVIRTMSLQPDGKLIIAGQFFVYNGVGKTRVARVNTNGSIDNSFNPGVGATKSIRASKVQADGRILLGGLFTLFNGVKMNRITRLFSNGSIDTTFLVSPGTNEAVRAIGLQSDGNIIVAGDFTQYNFRGKNRLIRLFPTGVMDSLFNKIHGANNTVRAIIIQPDNKYLVAGDFSTVNGAGIGKNGIARLQANGNVGTSFNQGKGANDNIRALVMQPDWYTVVAGNFTSYNSIKRGRIARININGQLDTTFLNSGPGANDNIRTLALLSGGSILIGGNFTSFNGVTNNRIGKLLPDGSLHPIFNTGIGANANIRVIKVQPDGKILVGGNFTQFNGVARNYLARLDSTGGLDISFNIGSGANGHVFSIFIQNDGKILVGGDFTIFNGLPMNKLTRLNSNGSVDLTFNPGLGANNSVRGFAVQNDGKIVVSGEFTVFDNSPRNRLVRLNSSGTVDPVFNPGTGANGTIFALAMHTDNRIIIGGDFTNYNGTGRNRIARVLNASPLPVELIHFSGVWNTKEVLLKWTTGSEVNNLGFYIQKMNETGDYSDIGFVAAGLFPNSIQHYDYTDIHVSGGKTGTAYYRLKQVDHDGRESLSYTIALKKETKKVPGIISLYPNPASKYFEIILNESLIIPDLITVENLSGKKLMEKKFNNPFDLNHSRIDCSSLNTGIYAVKIISAGTTYFTRLMIK